jgi:septal ring factor EnvC (AmiA/AmiB activator)
VIDVSDPLDAPLSADLLRALADLARSQGNLAQSQNDLALSQEHLAQSRRDYEQSRVELAQSHELVAQSRSDLAESRKDLASTADDLSVAERLAESLREALLSNRRVGMAMGILMERHRLTMDQAFDQLRTASQAQNVKVRELADRMIYTGTLDSD